MVTKSRPTVTRLIWLEVQTQYLHDIADSVKTYNIPNELIINAGQTPSRCRKKFEARCTERS